MVETIVENRGTAIAVTATPPVAQAVEEAAEPCTTLRGSLLRSAIDIPRFRKIVSTATAYEHAAKLIRGLVPYHREVSTRWIVAGGSVRLDRAELILDGWKIDRMTISTRRRPSDALDRS